MENARIKHPVCFVMVGVPASGKSTLVEVFKKTSPDAYVASTDNYIEQLAKERGLSYNEVFESAIKPAGMGMQLGVKDAVEKGQDIIWDQTNINRKSRAKIFAAIPKIISLSRFTLNCPSKRFNGEIPKDCMKQINLSPTMLSKLCIGNTSGLRLKRDSFRCLVMTK